MIVFGIHCNLFIHLPIRLKTYRSNKFFCCLHNNEYAPKRSGASEVLFQFLMLIPHFEVFSNTFLSKILVLFTNLSKNPFYYGKIARLIFH